MDADLMLTGVSRAGPQNTCSAWTTPLSEPVHQVSRSHGAVMSARR